jgi:hypothetical protein
LLPSLTEKKVIIQQTHRKSEVRTIKLRKKNDNFLLKFIIRKLTKKSLFINVINTSSFKNKNMSMKRLAVIAAVSSHNSFSNQSISYFNTDTNQPSGFNKNSNNQGLQTMRPGANLHGNVNIMLGG